MGSAEGHRPFAGPSKYVLRKMRDKAFARDVNRDDIITGAQELGVDLEEHISFVIASLKPVAGELGLNTGVPSG